MTIYEVSLQFPAAIADDYRAWLAAHVLLELPGFISADVFECVPDEPSPSAECGMCVQYHLQDSTALAQYLDIYAPSMRAQGVAAFGAQVRASRRVLQPLVHMLAPHVHAALTR
jgi:hypothetical protein